MAVGQVTGRITIKGKYQDGTDTKNVTIATISGVNMGVTMTMEALRTAASNIADAAQECVSATVTGFTFAYEGTDDSGYGTPGDELKPEEIFSEDFSNTSVTPTLQVVNLNGEGKTKTFNFKYMADPIDTADFDSKVVTLSEKIGVLRFIEGGFYNTFVKGDMSFSAKDTVAEAD